MTRVHEGEVILNSSRILSTEFALFALPLQLTHEKIEANISAVLRNTVVPEYRERKYEPIFLSKERRCWRRVYNMLL